MNILGIVINLPLIVGGIILILIAWALIKRGLRLIGTLITIAILLVIAWMVLAAMGIVPGLNLQG